jgi:secreted PhoX family phosphatase
VNSTKPQDAGNGQGVMQRRTDRRSFLRQTATIAAAAATLPALQGLDMLARNGRVQAAPGNGGYGPLLPKPDLRDGVVRIALPEGFQYRTFGVAGQVMSDGNKTPLAHDGMAVFNTPDGKFRLVRNHEDRNGPNAGSTAGDPTKKYDAKAGGGNTTLVINPFTRTLERDFISLNGTIVNCAGGLTPWGTWITCEETNAGTPSGWDKQHGYCFEVPAMADAPVLATPIPQMGRFAHEAVAVDPVTGYVYETEDNGGNSGFYRYLPNVRGQLLAGGQLQMLAVAGTPNYNTATGHAPGTILQANWVTIANPNPPGTTSTAVSSQGIALGAARFARLEGCWYGDGSIFFCSTSGGAAGAGQVWQYRPTSPNGGTLRLVYESPSPSLLDSPDNLAFSPQGALLLCEDGDNDQFLRGVTQAGALFDFALNLQNDYEWAGATFAEADPSWNANATRGGNAPLGGRWDRVTLFVNRQGATSGTNPPAAGNEGLTFAIWGPWNTGAL